MSDDDADRMVVAYVKSDSEDDRALLLKRLKAHAKQGDQKVQHVFQALWTQLLVTKAEVRLAVLPIFDAFVQRSKAFRGLLCDRLPRFVELTVAPERRGSGAAVPGLAGAAAQLRHDAAEALVRWHAAFGAHYPQLGVAVRYIQGVLHLAPAQRDAAAGNTDDSAARTAAPQLSPEALQQLQQDIDAGVSEAELSLRAAQALLQLLGLPPPAAASEQRAGADAQSSQRPAQADAVQMLFADTASDDEALQWEAEDPANLAAQHLALGGGAGEGARMAPGDSAGAVDVSQHALALLGFDVADDSAGHGADAATAAGPAAVLPADHAAHTGEQRTGDVANSAPAQTHDASAGAAQLRRLPKRAQDAVQQGLREARRVVQQKHLPQLHAWLAALPAAGAAPREGAAGAASSSEAEGNIAPHFDVSTQREQLQRLTAQLQSFLETIAASPELSTALDKLDDSAGRAQPAARIAVATGPRAAAASVPPTVKRPRDPAAPNTRDPWTLTQRPGAAPQSATALIAPTDVTAQAVGAAAPGSVSRAAGAGGSAAAGQDHDRQARLRELAQRAPVLPSGGYLKLWDTKEEQLDYVRQHMTQGQVYNHWGRVNDDVTLEPKQIEDMLAQRPVYYDQVATAPSSNGAPVKAGVAGGANSEGTARVHGAAASAVSQPVPRAQQAEAARAQRLHAAAQRATDTELPTAQARQADREYNREVLAAAGVASMHALGQRGGIDGSADAGEGSDDGGDRGRRGKKRAPGGKMAELQKLVRKTKRTG